MASPLSSPAFEAITAPTKTGSTPIPSLVELLSNCPVPQSLQPELLAQIKKTRQSLDQCQLSSTVVSEVAEALYKSKTQCDLPKMVESARELYQVEQSLENFAQAVDRVRSMPLQELRNADFEALLQLQDEDSNERVEERVNTLKRKLRLLGSTDDDIIEVEESIEDTGRIPLDPLTQTELHDPVRSKQCNHVFERDIIFEFIKNEKKKNRGRVIMCPKAGCNQTIDNDLLQPDLSLKRQIERVLKRKEQINASRRATQPFTQKLNSADSLELTQT